MAQFGDDTGGCAFAVLAVVAAVYFIFLPTSWQNAVWYGAKYGVWVDKVHTEPKPSDCDFMHAPLGNKDCTYKAHVKAYNAAGVLVGGEGAPKYGRNATGRHIVSYDDGKTWYYSEDTVPDENAASVSVFWLKEMTD